MPAAETRRAIIVFDGVCVLCNGWVAFLLRYDHAARYHFAAMQSDAGRVLLKEHGLNPEDPASFLLLEYDRGARPRASTDTDAIRRVLTGLGWRWSWAHGLVLLPRVLRDALYRWVARHRYRWFGKHDTCLIPAAAQRHRFL